MLSNNHYSNNHMVDGDDGTNPASPYYLLRKEEPAPVKCALCNHRYPADCGKRSKMTGEWYCTEFDGGCWEIQAKIHAEQNEEFGYAKTTFE